LAPLWAVELVAALVVDSVDMSVVVRAADLAVV